MQLLQGFRLLEISICDFGQLLPPPDAAAVAAELAAGAGAGADVEATDLGELPRILDMI